jgi:catechol 2,3-dioxygenase-like lactoylglutathione lyase family enzyme
MPAPLIEFPADDPERALRFWRGVLGTELEPRRTEAGSGWEIEDDGLRLGVHERGPGPGATASLPTSRSTTWRWRLSAFASWAAR